MRTKTRVGAVIEKDGKILLIHRRKKGREYWVLVGGGVEEGETDEEALAREVREETGLQVTEGKKVLEGDNNGVMGIKQIVYECRVEGGEPELGGPEKEVNCPENWYKPEWVEIEEVSRIEDIYPDIIRQWALDRLKNRV